MSRFLRVRPLRFVFRAAEPVFVPPGKLGNLFRGALGLALKEVGCPPECQGTEPCDADPVCAYRRIFAPKLSGGPSGLADPPRPFVFRIGGAREGTIEPGSELEISVHVFDPDPEMVKYLVVAMASVGHAGLGPGRGRCPLHTVEHGMVTIFRSGRLRAGLPDPAALDLETPDTGARRVEVEFVTPVEIKAGGAIAERPEFSVLMARIRDRVASLMRLYQGGAPEGAFGSFLDAAREVRLAAAELEPRRQMRQSTRTWQVHPLGGSVGTLVYEGPVGPFLPWLHAAEWTGVGRQTVWGKGQLVVRS